MWCSHMLKNSMSFTTTISSYFTSYNAPLTILRMSALYPLVRNRSAWPTRVGVRTSPSRSGSSPNCTSISFTRGASDSSPLGGMTFTTALFDFIGPYFKDVPRGLRDADLFQLRPRARESFSPIPFQPPADFHPQVLRGGHH